jgi:hypothetical protein
VRLSTAVEARWRNSRATIAACSVCFQRREVLVANDEFLPVDADGFVEHSSGEVVTTRWGGSLPQMLDFEKEARAAGLSDAQLRHFANMLVAERRWVQTGARCCK